MAGELYSFDFTFHDLPMTGNDMLRGSWKKVHFQSQRWKKTIGMALLVEARPHLPLTRAEIWCHLHSSRKVDFENRAFGFKPIVDAFVEHGVIVDDNDDVLIRHYPWEFAKRKDVHIRIVLKELVPC